MQKLTQKLQSVFENLTYWGIFVSLIFIPLYMKFPLEGISGTFVSIRLDDILIALVFLFWILYLVLSGIGKLRELFKDKLNQALLLFFFVGLVSVFSGVFLTKTITLGLGMLHFLRRVEFFLFLPLTLSVVKNKKQVYSLLTASLVVLVLVNIYAFGQRYLHFPVVSTTTSELSKGLVYYLQPGDRISSTFAGFYDLAIYMMMFICIAAPLIYYFVSKKDNKKIIAYKNIFIALGLTALSGISFIILIMTATRLSFVATLLGVFIALILIGKKRFILLIVVLAALSLLYPSTLRDRLVSTFTVNIQKSYSMFVAPTTNQEQRSMLNIPTLPNSKFNGPPESNQSLPNSPDITPGEPTDATDLGVFRSFQIRTNVEWPRALRALYKNPFLGTGYSSLGLATDNDYLRSLGEVGILGTFAFALLLIEIGKRLWKIVRNSRGFAKFFVIGVASLYIGFIINSLFIDVFEASKVSTLLWIILGLALSLGKFEHDEEIN